MGQAGKVHQSRNDRLQPSCTAASDSTLMCGVTWPPLNALQGRGYVLDTLAEIRERRDAGAARATWRMVAAAEDE